MRNRLARPHQRFRFLLDAVQRKRKYRRIQGTSTEQQRPAVRRDVVQTPHSARRRQLANGPLPGDGAFRDAGTVFTQGASHEKAGSTWRPDGPGRLLQLLPPRPTRLEQPRGRVEIQEETRLVGCESERLDNG